MEMFNGFSGHSLTQTYADEGHELSNVREHVYKSMEYYLTGCLSLDPDESKPGNHAVPHE